MVEHELIFSMMEKLGFDSKWIHWIKILLESGHSLILLNTITSKSFCCKRGVHQSDHLSPLMSVLVVELLQYVINAEFINGNLSVPIPRQGNFPIIQYMDGTIIFLPACSAQFLHLKRVLQDFALS